MARKEAEVPSAVRVARGERTRPVVAFAAWVDETAIVVHASGGQENTPAIRGSEAYAFHGVVCFISDSGII